MTEYVTDGAGGWARRAGASGSDASLDAVAFFNGADRVYRRGEYGFPAPGPRVAGGPVR